jgi:transcriptional regulator with XRE-family HTH domain
MVALPERKPKALARLLSQILRGLRLFRRRRPDDLAEALGIAPRSYGNFEAGKGRLNVERIHKLADLLKVDPYGIMAAIDIGSPAFAVRTADNMMMSIYLMALQEFDTVTGDAIAHLDAYTLMDAFTEMFDKLVETAKAQDAMIKRWRSEKPDGDPEGGEDA